MIKYKEWEFDDNLTVEDLLDLTDEERKPRDQFIFLVEFWEGRRLKKNKSGKFSKKIDTKILYKDLIKIQETVLKSFQS